MTDPQDVYDVVVIGGGSAGCVMAARLAEDASRTVLLLEAGPDYGHYDDGRWPEDILDVSDLPLTSHDWGFAGGEDAARARILGGCSSHNGGFVVRAPPGDHARWVALRNPGWGFAEQAPYLERAAGQLRTRIPGSSELVAIEASFLEAVSEIGLPVLGHLDGLGWGPRVAPIPRNFVGTVRWNAAFAYLDPVRAQPNLTIRGQTLVDRIVFDGTRAVAVVTRTAEGEQRVATHRVIVCAGAYMSPAILQRSGIGPEVELSRLGVPVVVPLSGVGENLLDHSWTWVSFASRAAVDPATQHRVPTVLLRAASARCRDDAWDTHVILELDFSSEERRPHITFHIFAMDSDSVGRIRLLSSDPDVLPALEQPFSDLSGHDVAVLVEGIALVRRLAGSRPLAPFVGEELQPGPVSDLTQWVRGHTGGWWHPVGTCRMGPRGDPGAVVDAIGRVHGVDGVVVADASIFPTIPRANPNLPTMGAAEYIAATLARG